MPTPAPTPDPQAVPVELFGPDATIDAEAEIRRVLTAAGYDPDSGAVDPDELDVLADPTLAPTPEPWRITNQAQADWAMARYGIARARIAELDQQLGDMIANARRWRARAGAWADRDAAFFRGHLERYALEVREASPLDSRGRPKSATLHTLYGDVPTRAGADGVIEIADQAKLAEWADDVAPVVVRRKAEVLVSTLRDHAEVDDKGRVLVLVPDENGEVSKVIVPDGLVTVEDKPATASAPKVDTTALDVLRKVGEL